MRDPLIAGGVFVRLLGVETRVVGYASLDEMGGAHPELAAKFRADGRWDALRGRFGGGPAELTWATLVGVAQRGPTSAGAAGPAAG